MKQPSPALLDAIAALKAKLSIAECSDVKTYAMVERMTGAELNTFHKWKIGKGVTGNVAAKRAAVAALLGVAPPS
jgi:hypothetical protein